MKVRTLVVLALTGSAFLLFCIFGCSKNSTGDDEVVDDGIAPEIVTDLAVASFTDSSVTLTWTASGDDSTSGTASKYELRMSDAAISWGNFDSARQISGLPKPKPSGETEEFEVLNLKTDSTYYFALRVLDERNNYQGVSNCVHATCFDDFAVNIPDPGLLAAIRVQISKPSGDILKSDLIDMNDLLAEDRTIADLAGLEYCTNLVILNLINNEVTDLTPLTNLDKLGQVNVGFNNVSDLTPLSGLTGLTWLGLRGNNVTDLTPVAGLINLTFLDLEGNNVSNVSSLTGMTQMNQLNLNYNDIEDITPLVANAGLGSGDMVGLLQNPLNHESIMTHIPALEDRGVSVQWTTNMTPPGTVMDLVVDSVSDSSAFLSWTAPGEDNYTGTAYLYDLRYSSVQSDLDTWTGAQQASGLPIPDSAGSVQSVEVTGLKKDTTYYFGLRTQDNSENWSTTSNIVWGKPFADEVVSFADAALEAVIRNKISKPLGDIYKSDLVAIDSIVGDNQGISDLYGLEYCVNLTFLHLINNNVSDLESLENLIGLYDVNLQNNVITDISPLAGLTNLEILQLTGNSLTSLEDLSSLVKLRYLAITFVGVSDIEPLGSLTALQFLFMSGNGITDITPLSNCPHLQYIFADYNSIQNLTPLSSLFELAKLTLGHNQIQDISPLVNNGGISAGDEIDLSDNPLSTASINTYIPALEARGATVTY